MGRPSAYHVVGRGIDTLVVNGYGELLPGLARYLDILQGLAKDAREARQGHGDVLIATDWTLAGMPLMIRPHGGGKGQWQWLLTCPGVNLDLGTGRLNGIGVRVRLGAAYLWEHGYLRAWEQIATLLQTFGNYTCQPSEVHLCADVAGLLFTALQERAFLTRGHVVRWAQEDALILDLAPSDAYQGKRAMMEVAVRYREPETLSFSLAAPQSAVVYNKPREIRLHSRDKGWFADIWRANGWDGVSPVVRVEFRSEREVLHDLHLETMDDLFGNLDGLWQYGAQAWLRHAVPQRDVRRSRWATSAWWKVVQAVTFAQQDAAPLERDHVRRYQEGRIIAALLGYAESLAAWRAGAAVPETLDLSTVLRAIVERADQHYLDRATTFRAGVMHKWDRIGRNGKRHEKETSDATTASN